MMRKRGYTLIELALVMFLLLFIALAVFSLTQVGSDAYLRLTSQQRLQSDLRIAISYLDVKVKQSDAAGAIAADILLYETQDQEKQAEALRITRMIDGYPYELWIFQHEGYLYELLKDPLETAVYEMGSRVVRADDFKVDFQADDTIHVFVSRIDDNGTSHQRERTIRLRSGGQR